MRTTHFAFIALILSLAASTAGLAVVPAGAGIIPNTYIVDTTSDAVVTGCQALVAADCSLRGAITNANADAAADTISFHSTVFPAGTPATITIASALPILTVGGETINATSRGVIIDGAGEPSNFACLTLSSNFNIIKGLQITDCVPGILGDTTAAANTIGPDNTIFDNTNGVSLAGNSNIIIGNKIGTSADGSTINPAGGNTAIGVLVSGDSNTIGGASLADRNIISGNSQNGVDILAGGTGNFVQGNYIGTDVTGTLDLGNLSNGVLVRDDNNTIGGSGAGQGNVISGNTFSGIGVTSATTIGVMILGNLIGTDATGTTDLGNGTFGVEVVSATNSTIGGTTAGARNIISGNNSAGIRLSATSGNEIQGNYIGTDVTGLLDVGNSFDGVILVNSANSNTIGGTAAGAGNVISGNNSLGIDIFSGTSNQVQGNLVGTDATGAADVGNSFAGVQIASSGNTIGGSTVAHRNVISGNNSTGVTLSGAGATGNTVAGNYIGVQTDGVTALGNTFHGIFFTTSASTNTIGGATLAAGNTIASNTGDGVYVFSGTGNAVRFNSIHSNTGLGIDLGGDGVTLNDAAPDTDAGANNLQNFPVLTTLTSIGGQTNVQGTATGPALTSLTFDFYHSPACDPSGNGEGKTHFGSVAIVTNATGNVALNQNFAAAVPANSFVTATTTAVGGHTSEFSNCVEVPPLIVNDAADPGDGTCTVANCTLREAIAAANATIFEPDVIHFAIGSGPQTIAVASSFPSISGPITIDGTSQPGFAGAPIIEINGAATTSGVHGLFISSTGNVVKGLTVNRFGGNGIVLNTGGSSTIQGNYIGTDLTGATDQGNLQEGILINNSANNLIGGDTAAERNVISGNNLNGIRVFGAGSTGNVISGNIIGLAVDGVTDIGNTADGVNLHDGASANTIGGDTAGERNIIAGNDSDGVEISLGTTAANTVSGNYIGTDITGTLDRGHPFAGVRIASAPDNTIGGASAGAGNLISGNNVFGVTILGGIGGGNTVQGNFIGTDAAGTAAVGNGDGVRITTSAPNNIIGGTTPGAGNVISGNNSDGIELASAAGTGNTIQGNYIGVEPDGVTALGNAGTGINIVSGSGTIVGGTASGARNVIAFNNSGVRVTVGTGNSVGPNSIHSNGGLGIDLNPNGVNLNDAGDGDVGANNLMNFPVLTSAVTGGVDIVVQFTFDGPPGTITFNLYSNAACDGSGNGEGETLVFSESEPSGSEFTFTKPTPVTPGAFLTMTATDQDGNTSEFSACRVVVFDADTDNDLIPDVTENGCGANIHSAQSIPERIDGAFAGVDDDLDTLTDEPLPDAGFNFDCDGDGYLGLNENGVPFCRNALNDDGPLDSGEVAVNDGCPAVGPAEVDCAGVDDNDADGRVNDGCPQVNAISEGSLQIGASDQDPCGLNGWPSNVNNGGPSANRLDILDVTSFVAPSRRFDTSPGHPFFSSRWDIAPGKTGLTQWINILDITTLVSGPTGNPPMLAGARAFDKDCPFPP